MLNKLTFGGDVGGETLATNLRACRIVANLMEGSDCLVSILEGYYIEKWGTPVSTESLAANELQKTRFSLRAMSGTNIYQSTIYSGDALILFVLLNLIRYKNTGNICCIITWMKRSLFLYIHTCYAVGGTSRQESR
jgi:hypothetical protein